MHEHVAPAVYYLEVHLLYASIVCLAAWVLTSLWKGNATWKYWIWVATSLNFIVPLGGFFNRFGASHCRVGNAAERPRRSRYWYLSKSDSRRCAPLGCG